MIKGIGRLINIISGQSEEPDQRNDGIVLKIMTDKKIIAYLSSEDNGAMYTLSYTKDFLNSGIPPFNMKVSENPEVGKVYKSNILWSVFTERVPNPSRPDFNEALKYANLKGDEPILEIIGKLSKSSISTCWSFEIDAA